MKWPSVRSPGQAIRPRKVSPCHILDPYKLQGQLQPGLAGQLLPGQPSPHTHRGKRTRTGSIEGGRRQGGGQNSNRADYSLDDDEEVGGCMAFWDDNYWTKKGTLRAQLLEVDPGLNQNLMSSATSVSQIFNQDTWERHRAPGRYWLYMQRLMYSTVLRRIYKPCLVFTGIALVVSLLNHVLPGQASVSMSLVPHTLLGAALSLLLVFRTNSSYARFTEGRMLWGGLIRFSRDWIRLAGTYMKGELRGRALRYVQVLAFVLKSHLRAGRTRQDPSDPTSFKDDPTVVVNELLPAEEAQAVLAQPHRPFYMICRMTVLARDAGSCPGIPKHVLLTLEHTLSELLAVVGGCDRLLGTPIPLSYTRHTSRSLVLWLASLPLALWPVTGWLTVPCMFVIAFIFLGIEETGIEIEEPFCILPLLPLCRTIVNDVNLMEGLT